MHMKLWKKKSLKRRKSLWLVKKTSEILISIHKIDAKFLTNLSNTIFQLGIFPEAFKIGIAKQFTNQTPKMKLFITSNKINFNFSWSFRKNYQFKNPFTNDKIQ